MKKWPEKLTDPVNALDNTIMARAQSILTGELFRIGPLLPVDQARDVIAWHELQRLANVARGIA